MDSRVRGVRARWCNKNAGAQLLTRKAAPALRRLPYGTVVVRNYEGHVDTLRHDNGSITQRRWQLQAEAQHPRPLPGMRAARGPWQFERGFW